MHWIPSVPFAYRYKRAEVKGCLQHEASNPLIYAAELAWNLSAVDIASRETLDEGKVIPGHDWI
jgi:hypothetical protein